MAEAAVPDVASLDGLAQARLVARGEVTPLELVNGAIERIEKLNPQLNAVIHRLYDQARIQARSPELPDGPFRGVPLLIKDAVCHTAGDPYHCGMRFLKKLGWTESKDTTLARRFRAAGFVILGKTNTPELAFSPTTEPLSYGPTHNPWDRSRSPGGSSGGSAAAVASGMVPIAHGNDMGGSIRIPSSWCGLVGLKPTRARSTLGPELGEFWWQLTHEHVLTRSVRDSAAVLDCIAGPAPGDPYTAPPPARAFLDEVGTPPGLLRIGLYTRPLAGAVEVHPACRAAAESTARLLETLGHHVEAAHPEVLDRPDEMGAVMPMLGVAIARELARWSARAGLRIRASDVEPTTWLAAEAGRAVSAVQLVEISERLHRFARELARFWHDGFDLLLTPAVGQPPTPLGVLGPEGGEARDVLARWGGVTPFSLPFNISGQPAISLPLQRDEDGLPAGVQLVAAYGREDLLIRTASQLEAAQPWRDRRPPVYAA